MSLDPRNANRPLTEREQKYIHEIFRLRAEVERLIAALDDVTRTAEDFLADNQTVLEAYGWGLKRLRMVLAARREGA